mmetsp:Transcript_65228/g.131200  ORF Transcript_65228/g.131200 Transcript_65228/m.131200 type:complete len:157 (-) Transcript_65228:384-854(-)
MKNLELVDLRQQATFQQQSLQFVNVAATCFVWRATWYAWDLFVGLGAGSALGSLLAGATVIIMSRWCKTSELSPASEGRDVKDRTLRVLYLFVLTAGICLYWRGCWSLADNFLGGNLPIRIDLVVTMAIGCLTLATVNCSGIGKHGILDYTALSGG